VPTWRRRSSAGRRPLRAARARSGQPPSRHGRVVCPRSGKRSAPPRRRPAAGAGRVPTARYGTRSSRPRHKRSDDAWPARPARLGAAAARHAAGNQKEGLRVATPQRTARIPGCPAAARRSASRAARTVSRCHHNQESNTSSISDRGRGLAIGQHRRHPVERWGSIGVTRPVAKLPGVSGSGTAQEDRKLDLRRPPGRARSAGS